MDTKAAKKKWRHIREYDRVLPKPIHKKTDDGSSLAHSQGIVESIGGQSNQSESSFVTYKQETPSDKRPSLSFVCATNPSTPIGWSRYGKDSSRARIQPAHTNSSILG